MPRASKPQDCSRWPAWPTLALLVLILPAIAACGTTAAPPRPTPGAGTPLARLGAPNIVLIVTDDLDAPSIAAMPNLGELLRDGGTTFAQSFVSTPLCCPARASILRGQYVHNHGVLTNTGSDGGFSTFHRLGREESTVATWLRDAGYRTGLFGKYLNGYPKGAAPGYVPPGWDDWVAGNDHEAYANFGYTLNENTRLVSYGDTPDDYLTDVIAAKTTSFIERAATDAQPFFAYVATYAPHGPSTPAPRHAEAFADVAAPRSPAFNEADVADKPGWVRTLPPLTEEQIAIVDDRHRERLRSLLAVDDLVGSVVAALRRTGTLDQTYILFTSDNGFHLGEHRLPLGKQSAYEESIRVPLVVRGPGVPAGRVVEAMVLNVDLAPTIAELAGASVPPFVDGRSLAPLLRGEEPPAWRQAFLVELFPVVRPPRSRPRRTTTAEPLLTEESDEPAEEGVTSIQAPPYRAVRTARYLYVEYDGGDREFYDLRADPHQLANLAATADPALVARLALRLAELKDCAAAGCRATENAPIAQP